MSGLIRRAKKGFLDADIDLLADDIKLALVDLATLVGTHCRVISDATNAAPSVITSNAHGFTDGDVLTIVGATGNTNINGLRVVANSDTNTFELTDIDGTAIDGNGAFGGTCYAVNLSTLDFYDDISAAVVDVSGNLGTKTTTDGYFHFAPATFAEADGAVCQLVMAFDDTPALASDKWLVAADDEAANLPVDPNGGDITYTPHANGMFVL